MITGLTEGLGSSLKLWSDKRNAATRITTLYDKIASLRNVKTIWQVDKEVDLNEFYHPARVDLGSGNTKEVHSLTDLPERGNLVLEGMVGLGKSILLRYLGSRELQTGRVIPLFIELRHRTIERTLTDLLLERLERWGLPMRVEVLNWLLATEKAAVLCDAFDEIPQPLHADVVHELEHLAERFPKTQIIVTSRADAPIQKSAQFRTVKLALLKRDDLPAIINKLESGNERAARLISELDAMPAPVAEVVKTPLMVTLLVLSYRATNRLPETVSDFYESLFHTLLTRHDGTKPGFLRPRKTGLSDQDIRKAFEAFCFFSRQKEITAFTAKTLRDVTDTAIVHAGVKTSGDDFIDDMKRITCLLLEDGGKHYFIHKSVQEFFAACFLQHLRDDKSIAFYSTCREGACLRWRVELLFLRHLDRFRFAKYFELPLHEAILSTLWPQIPESWRPPSKAGVQRFLNLFSLKRLSEQATDPTGKQELPDSELRGEAAVWWVNGQNFETKCLGFDVSDFARTQHKLGTMYVFVINESRRAGQGLKLKASGLDDKKMKRIIRGIEVAFRCWVELRREVDSYETNEAKLSFSP